MHTGTVTGIPNTLPPQDLNGVWSLAASVFAPALGSEACRRQYAKRAFITWCEDKGQSGESRAVSRVGREPMSNTSGRGSGTESPPQYAWARSAPFLPYQPRFVPLLICDHAPGRLGPAESWHVQATVRSPRRDRRRRECGGKTSARCSRVFPAKK